MLIVKAFEQHYNELGKIYPCFAPIPGLQRRWSIAKAKAALQSEIDEPDSTGTEAELAAASPGGRWL